MMRRCVESIVVQTDGNGALESFQWQRRSYRIMRTLDSWRDRRARWFGTRQTHRYFRVEAGTSKVPRVFELYQQGESWFLLAVQD